jgi:hypothetical protein
MVLMIKAGSRPAGKPWQHPPPELDTGGRAVKDPVYV